MPHHGRRRPDGWLRVGEAAEILHVAPKTLHRWAQAGQVPCQRTLGGHRRYQEQAIRDLLERQTYRPGEESLP